MVNKFCPWKEQLDTAFKDEWASLGALIPYLLLFLLKNYMLSLFSTIYFNIEMASEINTLLLILKGAPCKDGWFRAGVTWVAGTLPLRNIHLRYSLISWSIRETWVILLYPLNSTLISTLLPKYICMYFCKCFSLINVGIYLDVHKLVKFLKTSLPIFYRCFYPESFIFK